MIIPYRRSRAKGIKNAAPVIASKGLRPVLYCAKTMTFDSQSPSPAAPPLLEMRGIAKRFGGVAALSGVSLRVAEREILAVIGENGAGKSTLMKILGGVHTPDAGEMFVAGNGPIILRSTADASRLGIAFIHQELSILENLDIAANLFLGREPTTGGFLRLLDRNVMRERTRTYLEPLGLDVSPDTLAGELSLAQQQLVEIARALSQDARLIIMDEPTSSLTPRETEKLLTLMRKLRDEQGVSLIYISHRLNEVEEVADRVTVLRDGRNVGDLEGDQIQRGAMVRLMVGRDLRVPERAGAEASAETNRIRLEVTNLVTPRYPEKSVSFAVRAGEVLGFAGLVGAGRTEVAQAIFGVVPAVSGAITLDGELVRIAVPHNAISHGVYLIPEDRRNAGLVLSLPIRENISLPNLNRFATAGLIRRAEEKAVATDMATRLNVRSALGRSEGATIAEVVEAPARSLSGGNQQKVVLAKWLAMSPKVLLFDEPTRGVDVGAKAEIYDLIRGLAASGVSIMLISSDMEEVLAVSDRIAVMHEGAITGFLPRADFTEEAVMNLAVGGNK